MAVLFLANDTSAVLSLTFELAQRRRMRPANTSSKLSTVSSAIRSRVANLALPICGVMTTLDSLSSGSSKSTGSVSVTSSAAPAIRPPWRPAVSAA